jgi:hypothetical protein
MTESTHDWHAGKPSGSNLHGKSKKQYMEFRRRTEPTYYRHAGKPSGSNLHVKSKKEWMEFRHMTDSTDYQHAEKLLYCHGGDHLLETHSSAKWSKSNSQRNSP